MSNNNFRRVLGRMGAHELTPAETEKIKGSGGDLNTFASNTGTGTAKSPDCDFDQ